MPSADLTAAAAAVASAETLADARVTSDRAALAAASTASERAAARTTINRSFGVLTCVRRARSKIARVS